MNEIRYYKEEDCNYQNMPGLSIAFSEHFGEERNRKYRNPANGKHTHPLCYFRKSVGKRLNFPADKPCEDHVNKSNPPVLGRNTQNLCAVFVFATHEAQYEASQYGGEIQDNTDD